MEKNTVDLSKTKWIASFRLNKGHNIKPSVLCRPTRAVPQYQLRRHVWQVVKEDGTLLEKSYKGYNIVAFNTEKEAEDFFNEQVRKAIKLKENHIKKMQKSLETFKLRYQHEQI